MSSGPLTDVLSGGPGPGVFLIMDATFGKQPVSRRETAPAFGFGSGDRETQAKVFVSPEHAKSVTEFIDSPGPCMYKHQGGVGNQADSRKSTNASYGMGTSDRFFYESSGQLEKGAPGPGTYTLRSAQGRQVTSDKPTYSINSFTRAEQRGGKVYLGPKQQQAFFGRNSPGPAVYAPTASVGQQVSSEKPNVPKFGFGTADRFAYINIGQRAMQSPGPGAYSV